MPNCPTTVNNCPSYGHFPPNPCFVYRVDPPWFVSKPGQILDSFSQWVKRQGVIIKGILVNYSDCISWTVSFYLSSYEYNCVFSLNILNYLWHNHFCMIFCHLLPTIIFIFPLYVTFFPFLKYSYAKLHCKKRLPTFPFLAGKSLTRLSLGGNNLIFPPRESMVSDIPAGDGNVADVFYGVYCKYRYKSACGDRWNWFGLPVLCVCARHRQEWMPKFG